VQNDYNRVREAVRAEAERLGVRLTAKDLAALQAAFAERDETAEPVVRRQAKGVTEYEPDADLRDTENVPLKEDVAAFFDREVRPYAPDAWIDHDKTQVGYEINFNRHFYRYQPPRSLEAITADILALEKETEGLLKRIVAGAEAKP
jgi:type I restriction enzyme M protein